jgi:hypothetical protein
VHDSVGTVGSVWRREEKGPSWILARFGSRHIAALARPLPLNLSSGTSVACYLSAVDAAANSQACRVWGPDIVRSICRSVRQAGAVWERDCFRHGDSDLPILPTTLWVN